MYVNMSSVFKLSSQGKVKKYNIQIEILAFTKKNVSENI